MLITDLNLTYLSPLPENLNKEVKLFFLMGVFSINLMKIDSKLENSISQYYMLMLFSPLTLHPTILTEKSKTSIDTIFLGSFPMYI